MKSSYSENDVIMLLKDISGLVEPLPASEREKLIQSGVHYSEMLPLEYKPSQEYIKLYFEALENYSKTLADAISSVSEKIISEKGRSPVIVSLARAGIPIGILIKRYIENKYHVNIMHYAVSIIRGKGIDKNAIKFILKNHNSSDIQFVDGWTGKGAIYNELVNEVKKLDGVSSRLAVAADPAYITDLCGTHEDFIIPSSCLNSTISGLISRTFYRSDIIGKDDFHGAAYYGELINEDLSYDFINKIESCFNYDNYCKPECLENKNLGLNEVKRIASDFKINDINLIKPGIGETTRVLLRRMPWKILISDFNDKKNIIPILRLAEEKNIEVLQYPMKCYRACGIIKNVSADL